MKIFNVLFLFLFVNIFAQKEYPIIVKANIKDALIDDYKNLYVCTEGDLRFIKYDSLGVKKAETLLLQPFKIQSVENPLNIFLFSENTQEIKILDQNLNPIQHFDLSEKFGYVKAVFSEDLQYVWLLDSAQKKLIQYNHRDDKIINSFPLRISFEKINDFLIYDGKIYIVKDKNFIVYNFDGKQIFAIDIENGRKLRRENDKIFVIETQSISEFTSAQEFLPVFSKENYKIVEKNHSHFLALIEDKFYLYKIEN